MPPDIRRGGTQPMLPTPAPRSRRDAVRPSAANACSSASSELVGQATWVCVPPAPGYLEGNARDHLRAHGALLIFDEVMTGFRVAFGGAQQRYGIRPT